MQQIHVDPSTFDDSANYLKPWGPFVDSYRTVCEDPSPEISPVFGRLAAFRAA